MEIASAINQEVKVVALSEKARNEAKDHEEVRVRTERVLEAVVLLQHQL